MRLTGNNRVNASVITRPELEPSADTYNSEAWKRSEIPHNVDKIRLLPQFKNGANTSLYKNNRQYSDKVLQNPIVLNRFEIKPDEKYSCYHPTGAKDVFAGQTKAKIEKKEGQEHLYQHQV